jgi:hypothetical protein
MVTYVTAKGIFIMRAKTVGTLRKWKRDALELMWKCETRDTPSYSEVKITTRRLAELIDIVISETASFRTATSVKPTKEE